MVTRQLVRFAYVPFMLIGLNGLAIWLVASGQPIWWLAGILATAIGAAFVAERISPMHEEWNHAHDDTHRDVLHAVVYELSNMNSVLLLPVLTWLLPWQGIWPHDWPLLAQLVMAIIVADFGLSMLHWLSHRVPMLWRLHAIHHGSTRLYGFNGLVRHPLHQVIDLAIGTLPLVLAGMPQNIAILLGLAISVQLIVQHSNVDYVLGPFEKWLSIGKLHHMHHVNWGKEGDVNFGLFLTVWDRMMGTLQTTSTRPVTASDMGVDEPNFPTRFVDQIVHPFQSRPAGS
jgi:sterol desaturase/sphingolipid hydroxylase (fatty acid hydroxylase superfamily)